MRRGEWKDVDKKAMHAQTVGFYCSDRLIRAEAGVEKDGGKAKRSEVRGGEGEGEGCSVGSLGLPRGGGEIREHIGRYAPTQLGEVLVIGWGGMKRG